MDIIIRRALDTRLLNALAREALGAATIGVSVGANMSRIHLPNGNPPEQQRASDLLTTFGALTLSATSQTRRSSEGGPTFTFRADLTADDQHVAFLVLSADEIVHSGQATLARGEFSLTLDDLETGDYQLFVHRLRENYASGSATIRIEAAQA